MDASAQLQPFNAHEAPLEIPGFYGDSPAEALLAFGIYFGLAIALFTGPWLCWAIYDRNVSRKRGSA